jgi:hypothetical protein
VPRCTKVTRTVVDPYFRDALADRLHVAGISNLQSIDADLDARLGARIAQARKPAREEFSLPDLDHAPLVSYGIR